MSQRAEEPWTLAAWVFRDPDTAARLLEGSRTGRPAAQVVVAWPTGWEGPRRVLPTGKAPAFDSMSQSLLEVVVGVSLFMPLLPTPVDPGVLAGVGVPLRFVNGVRDEVTPGRSAVFVISSNGGSEFPDPMAGLLTCSLPAEVGRLLRPPR